MVFHREQRRFSSSSARAVVSAVAATDRPRPIATTKRDAFMSERTFNVAMAKIECWRIHAHLRNVSNATEMVPDEVVALATWQLPFTVVADGMASAERSPDAAHATETNCMAGPSAPAVDVAESTYIHGVSTCAVTVDAKLMRLVVWARSGAVDDIEVSGSPRFEVEAGSPKLGLRDVASRRFRANAQLVGVLVRDTHQRIIVLEYEDIVPGLGNLPERSAALILLPSRRARSRREVGTLKQAVLGEKVVKGGTQMRVFGATCHVHLPTAACDPAPTAGLPAVFPQRTILSR